MAVPSLFGVMRVRDNKQLFPLRRFLSTRSLIVADDDEHRSQRSAAIQTTEQTGVARQRVEKAMRQETRLDAELP